jgi:HAD superfamily hydrolase (TIGR01509 family)
MLAHIRGLIFDLDGTLVDSGLDFAAIRRETGFPEGEGLLEHLQGVTDPALKAEAEAIILRHELAGARRASWMPGAGELLQRLRRAAIPIGIVTRNNRQAAQMMLNTLAIPCDYLVAREDAPAKPHPGGLLAIARGWNLDPVQLVYVGDYVFDMQAAHNAGMLACWYDGGRGLSYADQADLVIQHFDGLAELLFTRGE